MIGVRIPTDLSGRKVVAALERIGFEVSRQRGSHIVLRRDHPFARVVVPDHKEIRVGTLRSILRQAGLSVEDLLELL